MTLMANLVSLPGSCNRADPGPDGRCRRCGRRAAFEAVYGKVVHTRGRPKGSTNVRTLAPVAVAFVRIQRCPDCSAALQVTQDGLRCPWTTSTRHRRADGVVACNHPYGGGQR